jgi:oxygen-independent coproporphyrinogen-3 oxidase
VRSYIHIPFCENKCQYCRFASIANINQKWVDTYISHLIWDIQNFKRPDTSISGLLESLYFWWWTPSILPEKHLQSLWEALEKKFWYEKSIEITLETNAKNLTQKNLLLWEKYGINRISLGIQTLNTASLEYLKRDKKEEILQALENIKNSKIQNISLDFILWLPYVKPGEIRENIQFLLENYHYIQHISVYMLEEYYDIEKNEKHFQTITYPPSWKQLWLQEDEYEKEYQDIYYLLQKFWFMRYEISNFAKPWYECKHNQWYWTHSEIVGFWLGSHSFINGKRYAYKDDFWGYYKWEFEYEEILNTYDIFLEKVIFWLRTSWLSEDIYKKLHQKKLKNLVDTGFLEYQNNLLILTLKGVILIDKILVEIW